MMSDVVAVHPKQSVSFDRRIQHKHTKQSNNFAKKSEERI